MNKLKLRVGDWVEVHSKNEILQTLDQDGRLDGMPFMPEMFAFCGKRFQVYKSSHKTCDTVFPVRSRRLHNTVHLQTRCDGSAHGGCQAGCLIFWKEAWLKRVEAATGAERSAPQVSPKHNVAGGAHGNLSGPVTGCTEEDVVRATRSAENADESDPTYVCQATRLPYASENLSPFDVRQYLEDWTSGNVGLPRMACGFLYMGFRGLENAGIGLGRPLRLLYDVLQRLLSGVPYPRRTGRIAAGSKTPGGNLNLQPGEWVRVKSYEEILTTLDTNNRNRGLYFDAELVPYCGRTFRVLKLVNKIVDEKTGRIMEFKNPCIMLAGVVCEARYSECRLFCPRSIYSYWREIWLERVNQPAATTMATNAGKPLSKTPLEV